MAILAKLVSKSSRLFRSESFNHKKLERSCSSTSSCSSYDLDLDHDDDLDQAPSDVPKGCMAIYVGISEKKNRFVVGTHLLRNPVFQVLLQRAAEEYGYENVGALNIPCEPVLFEHFLWLLNNNDPAAAMLEVNDLLAFYSG